MPARGRQAARVVAEGAAINRGLLEVARDSHDGLFDPPSPIAAAVPFERALSREGTDVRELVTATPEELADRQREARHDLEATQKAAAILYHGRANAYDKALGALLPDSRDWWQEYVEEEEYPASAEGLADFIRDHLEPLCRSMESEVRHQEAMKIEFGYLRKVTVSRPDRLRIEVEQSDGDKNLVLFDGKEITVFSTPRNVLREGPEAR